MNIKDLLGFKLASSRIKYLGLPLYFSSSKKAHFEIIQQRITQKLAGWKAKLFSQAGRTTLIKSVASSMPSYMMSTLIISKSV
ncbi:hypothetical protein I3760_08G119300 [Carya illinoinensis]|nr:hypothetical protein I3760_08G119300 [Carya illinoinensis]